MSAWTPTDVQNTIAAFGLLFDHWGGFLTALTGLLAAYAIYKNGKTSAKTDAISARQDAQHDTLKSVNEQLTAVSGTAGEAKGIANTVASQVVAAPLQSAAPAAPATEINFNPPAPDPPGGSPD